MRKVINTKTIAEIGIDRVTEEMVVVFQVDDNIYLAHRGENTKWSFVSLFDGKCHANGFFPSLHTLLENTITGDIGTSCKQGIYVLNDIFEIEQLR